jgi:hypothetical protein
MLLGLGASNRENAWDNETYRQTDRQTGSTAVRTYNATGPANSDCGPTDLSVRPSLCPSVRLSIRLSLRPSVRPSVRLSVRPSDVHLPDVVELPVEDAHGFRIRMVPQAPPAAHRGLVHFRLLHLGQIDPALEAAATTTSRRTSRYRPSDG